MEFYNKSVNEILENLGSSKKGLTKKEVELRISKYGLNELQENKENKIFNILIDQFKDFLVSPFLEEPRFSRTSFTDLL